jgi:hypothetical protein
VAVIAVDEAGAGLDSRQNDRLASQELDHGARGGYVKGHREHRAVDAGVAGAVRVGGVHARGDRRSDARFGRLSLPPRAPHLMLVRLGRPAVDRPGTADEPLGLEVDRHRTLVPAVRGRADVGQAAHAGAIAQQVAVKDCLTSTVLAQGPVLRDDDRHGAVDKGDVRD